MPEEPPQTPDEFLAPYEHPYRHYLPGAMRAAGLVPTAVGGAVFAGASVGAAIATDSLVFVGTALVIVLFTLAAIARWGVAAALVIRRVTAEWDQRSELGAVRERRPHAAEAASDVVHDQFAVTVEDDGNLLVWRYTPLSVNEAPASDQVLVPGRPSFAAEPVEERKFDPDTALAAGQLVEAQERAAELELDAIERARTALEEAARRRELEQETASTAAALRNHTGQSSKR